MRKQEEREKKEAREGDRRTRKGGTRYRLLLEERDDQMRRVRLRMKMHEFKVAEEKEKKKRSRMPNVK